MWSLGCIIGIKLKVINNYTNWIIIGELLTGKPMFPGTSTLNQLDRILEFTGRPSQDDIEATQNSLTSTMLDAIP